VKVLAGMPCPTNNHDESIITSSKRLRRLTFLKEQPSCDSCPHNKTCKFKFKPSPEPEFQNDKFGVVNQVYMDAKFSDLLILLHGIESLIKDTERDFYKEKSLISNEIQFEYKERLDEDPSMKEII
jgi:hypothetical protein